MRAACDGISNPAHALVGQLITILLHIEERMIAVLARLLRQPETDTKEDIRRVAKLVREIQEAINWGDPRPIRPGMRRTKLRLRPKTPQLG